MTFTTNQQQDHSSRGAARRTASVSLHSDCGCGSLFKLVDSHLRERWRVHFELLLDGWTRRISWLCSTKFEKKISGDVENTYDTLRKYRSRQKSLWEGCAASGTPLLPLKAVRNPLPTPTCSAWCQKPRSASSAVGSTRVRSSLQPSDHRDWQVKQCYFRCPLSKE